MQFLIDKSGPSATLTLTGRLDVVGAQTVATPLAELSRGRRDLVVDMSGVTFIASIGLRYLVATSKAVRRRGGNMVLLNPKALIVDIIETSGLSELLPVEMTGA